MKRALAATVLAAGFALAQPAPQLGAVLRAMTDELARSRNLKMVNLEAPYYIDYSIEDADVFTARGEWGGLIESNRNQGRIAVVEVRVGDYQFDNTNHARRGESTAARYDQWPLDDNYAVLRQALWLATDRAYKASLEAIARKRAALKNSSSAPTLADFYKAAPVRNIEELKFSAYDETAWARRVAAVSGGFNAYPELQTSSVALQFFQGVSYFINTEGSLERGADELSHITVRANGQAPDGMELHDAVGMVAFRPAALPTEEEMARRVAEVGSTLRSLMAAPVADAYSGPVLFEGIAAAQLMAQLVGDNVRVPRRPVTDPGQPLAFMASEFESKLGSRVLPEWIDIVDDATQTELRGRQLIGHYSFDTEGMPPKPVSLVEKGVLKSFLTTRQPITGANESTGHGRLMGGPYIRSAAISNLFVRATPPAEKPIKTQLIELIQQRGKPFGLLVRKLDYPSSASFRELRSMMTGAGAGGARPVSPPIAVYRVYPDGREELVRGLRFRGLGARSLRDIVSASPETFVFDFVNNAAPLALIGAGGFLAPATVVSPSLLFDEVELERVVEEWPKPPLVPPPPADGGQ